MPALTSVYRADIPCCRCNMQFAVRNVTCARDHQRQRWKALKQQPQQPAAQVPRLRLRPKQKLATQLITCHQLAATVRGGMPGSVGHGEVSPGLQLPAAQEAINASLNQAHYR